jgi:outer membrane protein OmpA-like peptidoglycan-associated protein
VTSRSPDGRGGARTTRTVTAAAVALVVLALVPAAPASADATPGPTPTPGATATSLEGLSAPVRDFSTVVESIDGTETRRASKTRRTVILDSKVLFGEDSARLSGSARRRLQEVAREIVDSRATGTVQVDGYTDDQGSAAYGLVLSRKRANAVRDVLAPLISAQGVTIKTRGRGEADPRFPNRDRSGREIPKNQAKNRRVEITFSTR